MTNCHRLRLFAGKEKRMETFSEYIYIYVLLTSYGMKSIHTHSIVLFKNIIRLSSYVQIFI